MPQQPEDDWLDVSDDDWQDVTDTPEPVAAPESKGLLQRWDENIINQPLSRHLKINDKQIFDPKYAADFYDPASAKPDDQWRIPSWVPMIGGGTYRSLGAGLTEGAGNVVEGLTTPLNLATAGTSGVYSRAAKTATTLPALAASAYTTAPKVANVARRATQALSAPMVASGAARASEGYRTGEYGNIPLGIAEMAGGAAGALVPKVGGRAASMPDELPLPTKKTKVPQVDEEGNLAVSELMAVRKAQQRAREGLPAEEIVPEQPAQAEIPVVSRDYEPADYAMDNAHITARGGEVSPQMAELAKPKVRINLDNTVTDKSTGKPFDPASLGFKTTKTEASPAPFNPPELEFVDRNTGEIKPASEAQPGDVPLVNDDTAPAATDNIDADAGVPSTRRAGKLAQFVSNLVKSESGEYNPNWAEEFRQGRNEPAPPMEEHRWVPEVASPWHPITGEPPARRLNRDIRRDQETDSYFDRNSPNWDDATDVTPEEQARAIGINTGDKPDPTANMSYSDSFKPREKGLSLDELESTKKKTGLERLGKLMGEQGAARLKSGEQEIKFSETPLRKRGNKKLSGNQDNWTAWGDDQVAANTVDPSKPGLSIENRSPANLFPKAIDMVYRDAQGKPIGVLSTDMAGKGISTLAVNSDLGLRRGKVAFAMLKEAFDRGISEPSGSTSDFTKNLIERVKRLVKDDKGEFDMDALGDSINKIIDDIAGSKMGKAVGRFLKDESGEGDIGPSRLPKELRGAKPRFNVNADTYLPNFADDLDKALYIISQNVKSKADAQYMKFVQDQTGLSEVAARNLGQKVRGVIKKAVAGKETGKIDIPPVARAKQLEAQAAKQTPESAKPPLTPKEYIAGKPQVDTGPLVPENVKPPVGPAPEAVASLAARLKKAVETKDTPNAVAPDELAKLMDEADEVLKSMPEGPEKAGVIRQLLGANKAFLTSWDLSAPGRQGKAFMLNKSYWNAVIPMIKSWGSKDAAHIVNQSILDHKSGYFEKPISAAGKQGKSFAEKMGLDLAAHEEAFTGVIERLGAKIPGVQRSSRAHTAFLNKLRADQFVSMMDKSKAAGLNPEANPHVAKAYAKFINDATGRGSVNIGKWKLERNINVLNDVFFAPKNMSGQIRTWNAMLNPAKYWMADTVLRKQALKSLFAVAGLGLGVGQIASMAGAKVSDDIFSTDFRKIKIGDTRIDLFGGYQQFPVAAMKFIMGKSTPTSGDNAGETQDLTKKGSWQTRGSIAEKFFTNRLSPVGSFIWAWMWNREFDGKPFEVKRALYERTLPIAAKDIAELAQEDPALALILGPATLTGLAGTQTYSGR
jgi:hypothetical protein